MPRKKKTDNEDMPAAITSADPAGVADEPEVEVPEAGERAEYLEVDRAVVFRLDGQRYGLPLAQVQEIQQIVQVKPVPGAAPALAGMIDVRGVVVPVLDLRLLVGLSPAAYGLDTPMILCRAHGRLVSLIVDEVEDVMELAAGSMQPPSSLYAISDRLIGVCRIGDDIILVTDAERLVPDSALVAISDAGGGDS